MISCLADAGKGTVAKPDHVVEGADGGLADAGKGTVAKLAGLVDDESMGLADAGKGTVAKRILGRLSGLVVLPTLEKELWQSSRNWL